MEDTIKDGPNDRIDGFIEALSNVYNAIEYFEDNNPTCTELANLVTMASLNNSFRSFN
ncbi:MAG: hypothetical protein ACKE51_00540 [Methylococcaceae bacterium]